MSPTRRLSLLLILLCFLLPFVKAQDRVTTRPRLVNQAETPPDDFRHGSTAPAGKPARHHQSSPQLSNELLPDDSPDALVPDKKNALRASRFPDASLYSEASSTRLLEAMESRLGLPYRYNGTDDSGFDCSGFVWRVFQEAGLNFERSSARHYWTNFPEATEEEARLFGTLIFFSELGHVGIVRDEKSFYHASTSQGVIVSPLSGYWGSRIVGFRRVPLSPVIGTATRPVSKADLKIEPRPESKKEIRTRATVEIEIEAEPRSSVDAEAEEFVPKKGKKGRQQMMPPEQL